MANSKKRQQREADAARAREQFIRSYALRKSVVAAVIVVLIWSMLASMVPALENRTLGFALGAIVLLGGYALICDRLKKDPERVRDLMHQAFERKRH